MVNHITNLFSLRSRTMVTDFHFFAALGDRHGFTPNSYELLFERDGRNVNRVSTDRGELVVKWDATPGTFDTEIAMNEWLASEGIPVAEVHGSGEARGAYLVLSWIEGTGLSSASPIEAQRDAGRLLRRVHRLGNGAPPYADKPEWGAWMKGWVNHALHWWQQEGGGTAVEAGAARRKFDALYPMLSTRDTDFILFDGRPDHFIVHDGRLSGLIDVAAARGGDAAMDLGVMAVTDPALLPGVLEGYAPDSEEQAVFDALIPFYTFLRRLALAEWDLKHVDGKKAAKAIALLKEDPFSG